MNIEFKIFFSDYTYKITFKDIEYFDKKKKMNKKMYEIE
jgi:hypothetical protein